MKDHASPDHEKLSISIIIPTVSQVAKSTILAGWHALSQPACHAQFVFLINQKQPSLKVNIVRHEFPTHEVLEIPSDRYFGSCEENIERAVDFVDELADMILVVGEHDAIDWQELQKALEFFDDAKLAAMAINIKHCQRDSSGDVYELDALARPDSTDGSHPCIHSLFNGNPIDSASGFTALISSVGPIDWAAYIGSHIYSREAFRRLFMHRLSEHVYSFVYKQLLLFTRIPCRYALYSGTPVHRISDDFHRMRDGTHSFGWLESHRTVRGFSPCFWIANLQSLNELSDPSLFKLVTYSRCWSIVPGPNHRPTYSQNPLLRHILHWCEEVVKDKLNGRSFYMPDRCLRGHCGDIYSVYLYLDRIHAYAIEDKALRSLHGSEFIRNIQEAVLCIANHLALLTNDLTALSMALPSIENARLNLTRLSPPERFFHYGLSHYLGSMKSQSRAIAAEVRKPSQNKLHRFGLELEDKFGRALFRAKCLLKTGIT